MSRRLTDIPGLNEALRRMAESRSGSHTEPDLLLRYLEGQLTEEEGAEVLDHLEACRRCATVLLDLKALSSVDEGEEPSMSELELARGWRDLRQELALTDRSLPGPTKRLYRNVAAAMALATIALFLWTTSLRRELGGLRIELADHRVPEPNVSLVLVTPPSRTSGSETQSVRVFRDSPPLVLAFDSSLFDRYSGYRVELRRGSEDVWSGELVTDDDGILTVGLSPRSFPTGSYVVVLYGVEGAERRELTTTELEILAE